MIVILELTHLVLELKQYGIVVVGSKPIGKGSFGEVWRARMNNEEDVVVKIITNNLEQSLTETMIEMETLR